MNRSQIFSSKGIGCSDSSTSSKHKSKQNCDNNGGNNSCCQKGCEKASSSDDCAIQSFVIMKAGADAGNVGSVSTWGTCVDFSIGLLLSFN